MTRYSGGLFLLIFALAVATVFPLPRAAAYDSAPLPGQPYRDPLGQLSPQGSPAQRYGSLPPQVAAPAPQPLAAQPPVFALQDLPPTQSLAQTSQSLAPSAPAYSNPRLAANQNLFVPGTTTPNTASRASFIAPPSSAPPCVDGCVDCDQPWHSQVLPHGLIYQSYMAGPKEPRLGSFFNTDEEGFGTIWDVVLGGRVGLYRYGTDDPNWPEGWQVDMEGAVFPRLDPLGESTPLISSDYRFGIPVTYGNGNWQFKLAYFHISAHLGDEYIIDVNPGATRINYVRDGIAFGVGYFFTPAFRLYGEVSYAPGTNGGAEPIELQTGFDWAPARNTGLRGAPFMAVNASSREEVDYGGHIATQFGWCWRRYARGSTFRIGGQYFYGKSDQYEFFDQTESRLGWGIWYDF